tara:strand:- start:579 stop:965 length:387 start_codon:yes stop_codon:yes gene_type:complete
MEKAEIRSGETWRFYPRQSVDTWEVIIPVNGGSLEFKGVNELWSGEDWNISSGTKTLISANTPSATSLTTITPTLAADAVGQFAIDLGFKALQVKSTGGTATVMVKAYSKSHGTPIGSGYVTGSPITE